MKAQYRLKKNYQYNYVFKKGKAVKNDGFVLLFCPSKGLKVGFSISKKHGNAVQRNRLRRQLKDAISRILPDLKGGFSLIIVPRKDQPYLFCDITSSLDDLVTKAGLRK